MSASPQHRDPLARALELGLIALLFLAPLPFGAVPVRGRLALELGALALGLLWTVRALLRPVRLLSRPMLAGLCGLLLLGLVQIVPTSPVLVGLVSPRTVELREATQPQGEDRAAEQRLLGADPVRFSASPTLSLDPGATASALRTGTALACLLLVATTVAQVRGAGGLCGALLASAAFQALYGLLVVATGHERIWNLPKQAYLGSATGTFVNRNHFACFLAMSLACGAALILHNLRAGASPPSRRRFAAWLGGEGSRNLILALLLVLGLAGLLASLSRAGIALGLLALTLTVMAAGRSHRLRTRAVIAVLVIAAASVPVAQLGAERLTTRYAHATEDLVRPGLRSTAWTDTVAMAVAYPWAGAGFGTFGTVYPAHRSPEVRRFLAHAHNDLLQAGAEGGLVGLLFLALLLGPLLGVIIRSLAGGKGPLAVGLAAGLSALLLHSLIDFNLHIPANAATGAVLAGALMGLPWNETD